MSSGRVECDGVCMCAYVHVCVCVHTCAGGGGLGQAFTTSQSGSEYSVLSNEPHV